jgi:hypothetical protein
VGINNNCIGVGYMEENINVLDAVKLQENSQKIKIPTLR